MDEKPEPLRLADALECGDPKCKCTRNDAATELRRLHEVNQMLLEALKRIDSLRGPFMSEDAVSLCWKLVDNAINKATGETK